MSANCESGRGRGRCLALLLVLLGCCVAAAAVAARPSVADGERMYRQGVLSDGRPLHGGRADGGTVEGAAAACTNCHRRSGLGVAEGSIVAPPITPRYLFPAVMARGTLSGGGRSDRERARTPYTDATLARAIRAGIGRDGHPFNYLMPRFDLDDAAMASLIAYLRTLPVPPAPGVTDDTLNFATIITPDADPAARAGMLAVLKQFIDDKNAFIRGGRKPLQTVGQIDFRVTRRWQLHVWELHGAPETWGRQLDELLAREPVFAVLSGLAGRTWEPVHRFCERAGVPCLFPNVDVPPVAEDDFYSLYLSKGVLLEAELIARRLADGGAKTGRLVQVYRPGDRGEAGALALAALAPKGLARTPLELRDADVAGALARGSLTPDDTLVLWLPPADLAALRGVAPPPATVFASGLLGGLDQVPLDPAWRKATLMTYPVDLPAARAIRMTYPHNWFRIRHVPVTSEKVQADTYLACGIVAEALNDMLDNFVRDFLVERIEVMISHRQLSGYYPHLGLAPGQRFASKGGYLVRFATAPDSGLVSDGDWTVP